MSMDSANSDKRRRRSRESSDQSVKAAGPQSEYRTPDRRAVTGGKIPPIAAEAFPSAEPMPPPRVVRERPGTQPPGALPVAKPITPEVGSSDIRKRRQVRRQVPAWGLAIFFVLALVTLAGVTRWMVQEPVRDTGRVAPAPQAGDPWTDRQPPDFEAEPAAPVAPAVVADPDPELPVQVREALQAARWESAGQLLREALGAEDLGERAWARNLLEELERAGSHYSARRTLERLSDAQLERFMRENWLPPDVEDYQLRPLQERFLTLLNQYLPEELKRRHEQTRVEAPTRVEEDAGPAVATGAEATQSPEPDPQVVAQEQATERLAERGLQRREGHWLFHEDDDLAERIQDVNKRHEAAREAAIQWNELQPVLHRMRVQREQAAASGQRGLVESLEHRLRIGRAAQARAMQLHNEALLATLQAADRQHQLVLAYQQLAEDPQVREAVSPLPAEFHLLGPTAAFQKNARQIEGLRSQLLAEIPQFLPSDGERGTYHAERGTYHVAVILNEQVPEILAMRPRASYNLLAESLVRQAEVPISTEQGRQLNLGGVRFFAPQAILPSLRLGRHVSRNVPVYVIPEDIRGRESFLSPQAFPDYRLVAEPGSPNLRVQSRAP